MTRGNMKIMMVLSSPTYEVSSAASHTTELRKALLNNGVEVKIISPDNQQKSSSEMPLLEAIRFIQRIKKTSKSETDAIIHVRSLRLAFLMSLPLFRPKSPILLEANGIWSDEHGTSKIKKFIIRVMEKYALNHASTVICVTEQIKEEYLPIMKKRNNIFVVENGVDPDKFKPIPNARQSLISKYNIVAESKIVLFVGQFYAWQGIDILIESFKEVIKRIPSAKLVLVGSGEEEMKLKRSVEISKLTHNILFTGRILHEQIPTWISAADIVVSLKRPMKSGYSPLKIYEYLACEKPVVATNVNGYEFIEKVNCGMLVPYGNTKKTAEAIITLLENDNMGDMGRNGRKYILSGHTWDDAAKKVIEISSKMVIEKGER